MKGLLIKDLKIIMNQKKFLIMYLFVAIVLSFSMDSTFIVSYFPMVGVLLILSTITYDYQDDGFSFLMTLPINPGDYAVAKYVFSILGTICVWGFSVILQFAGLHIQKTPYVLSTTLITDACILAMFMIIISIMIPIDIKYSTEKGRIVMFLIFGIVMGAVIAGKGILEVISNKLGITFFDGPNPFDSFSPALFAAALYAVCVFCLSISMMISIRVMKKREF